MKQEGNGKNGDNRNGKGLARSEEELREGDGKHIKYPCEGLERRIMAGGNGKGRKWQSRERRV